MHKECGQPSGRCVGDLIRCEYMQGLSDPCNHRRARSRRAPLHTRSVATASTSLESPFQITRFDPIHILPCQILSLFLSSFPFLNTTFSLYKNKKKNTREYGNLLRGSSFFPNVKKSLFRISGRKKKRRRRRRKKSSIFRKPLMKIRGNERTGGRKTDPRNIRKIGKNFPIKVTFKATSGRSAKLLERGENSLNYLNSRYREDRTAITSDRSANFNTSSLAPPSLPLFPPRSPGVCTYHHAGPWRWSA